MINPAHGHARRAALSSVLVGVLLLVGLASPAAATPPAESTAADAPAVAPTPSPGPDDRQSGTAEEATNHALKITEPTPSDLGDVEGDAAQAAATGKIAGTVKGSRGQTLSGVVVSVWSSNWDGVTAWDYPLTFVQSVVTNGAGAFTLTVPGGYYTLFYNPVDDPDSAWSWVGGQAVPGKNPTLVGSSGWQANASLGVSHSITGTVTGGPQSTRLSTAMTLWACSDRGSIPWCSRNWDIRSVPGGYGFWQLPTGNYLIEVSPPDSRYKGEWWNDKPDFAASNFIHVANGIDVLANINLAQYVQALPSLPVTGTAAVGTTLSLTPPPTVAGATYGYVWYADAVIIAGSAGKTSILLTSAQSGKQISARVRVTKPGYAPVARYSAKTTRVTMNSAPTISGHLAVGHTLTAATNTWTSGMTFTYKWYSNGHAIPGATAPTYTLTPAERDTGIQVSINGSKPDYTTMFRSSKKTALVAQIAAPTIGGAQKAGRKLTALTPGWTPGTTFQYRWYADRVGIRGAVSRSIILVPAYIGKKITVRVVGSKTGYATFSQTSPPTGVIVR